MKILNLFAGIGGNRTLWGDGHEITAIEYDPKIASLYRMRFPNDKVYTVDAYEYLETYYREYEFIWASPPCTTHSKNMFRPSCKKKIPDFRLYGLIFFLNMWFEGKWVVENVKVIDEMIPHTAEVGRHYIWANFYIKDKNFPKLIRNEKYRGSNGKMYGDALADLKMDQLLKIHKIPFNFSHEKKRAILRNCVDYRVGKYILDSINTPTIDKYLEEEK